MSKATTCNSFGDDVDSCLNAWIERRVIPYSNAYTTAHENHLRTLDARKKELELQREMYFTVAVLAGSALLAWAPAAAVVAAGSRGFRGTILLRVASAAARRFNTSRTAAYRVLKNFTYGTATEWVTALASGPGKTVLTRHIDREMQTVDTSAASGRSSPQAPLLHRNELEEGVRAMARELKSVNQSIRDDARVSEGEASGIHLGLFQNSRFFQEAPVAFTGNHPLRTRTRQAHRLSMPVCVETPGPISRADQEQLSRDMEKVMWANWVLGLVEHVASQVTYAGGMAFVDPAHDEYTDPGYSVEQQLNRIGVMIPLAGGGRQRAGEFFGGRFNPTTDGEVQQLIQWGRNFLRTRAREANSFLSD